jgi:integrase/recombinase XerD
MSKQHPRNLAAGPFQVDIDSFDFHLCAENKSKKTIRACLGAAQWFAAEILVKSGKTDWEQATKQDVQKWIKRLLKRYSDSYANNQHRALQQFFRWWAAEFEADNPMAGMSPPKVGEKLVSVFEPEELKALLDTAKGKDFQARRDYAIMSLFKDTGARLAELTGVMLDEIDLKACQAIVTGKGNKQRRIQFTHETARAIDRYLRERSKHKLAHKPNLWLGMRGDPLKANGVYQMIKRRGDQCGVDVYPHRFRHDFSHVFLDNGGLAGDLMELNGWTPNPWSAGTARAPRPAVPRATTTRSWRVPDERRALQLRADR